MLGLAKLMLGINKMTVLSYAILALGTGCCAAFHFLLGLLLGALKDRTTKPYSFLWWCITFTFLPFGVVPLQFYAAITSTTSSVPFVFTLAQLSTLVMHITTSTSLQLLVLSILLSTAVGQNIGSACRVIGLTGGIATGKSTVAQIYREKRIPVIDADVIARDIVQPGESTYDRIVHAFGVGILEPPQERGTSAIDRTSLGQLVFDSPEKRQQLNRLTHPQILWHILKQVFVYRVVQRKPYVVLDAPLLYESGILPWLCSPIIVVSCSPSLELERLMARDQLTEDAAQRRMEAQMPLMEKVQKADLILDNSDTKAKLIGQALATLRLAMALLDKRDPPVALHSPRFRRDSNSSNNNHKPPTPPMSRRNVI